MKTDTPKEKFTFSTSLLLTSNFLTGVFAFSIAIFLSANFLTDIEHAHAVTPSISSSSNIFNGAIDPVILVDSNNFASDSKKSVFTVDVGTTGLIFDSVAFYNSTRVRLNFRGTAQAGEISVQATKSAFMPVANSLSNALTITVPVP